MLEQLEIIIVSTAICMYMERRSVATFARATKVQCGITSCNVQLFRLASKLMYKLTEKLAASYKVMCECTMHVSQQPSHFLSLLKRSGTIDSVNMYDISMCIHTYSVQEEEICEGLYRPQT